MAPALPQSSLLPILEKRENLGCHREFGGAATILRVTRISGAQAINYRVFVVFDGGDGDGEEICISISSNTLTAKSIHPHSDVLETNSRVFVLAEPRDDEENIFFLEDQREVIRFLRVYVRFLHQRNDQRSHELFERLTGLSMAAARADDDLCLALVQLRQDSIEHVRKLLQDTPDHARIMQAMDRGEFLELHRKYPDVLAAAEDMPDSTLRFLINVVRARYYGRVQEQVDSNNTSLSNFGEKIFRNLPLDELSPRERRALFSLAIRSYDK